MIEKGSAPGLGKGRRLSTRCESLADIGRTASRLEQAATMLRMPGRASVTDIAFSCGFNSSKYFSYAFRKRYGHAPRRTMA
jgi:AraC-like DNA-binding protein